MATYPATLLTSPFLYLNISLLILTISSRPLHHPSSFCQNLFTHPSAFIPHRWTRLHGPVFSPPCSPESSAAAPPDEAPMFLFFWSPCTCSWSQAPSLISLADWLYFLISSAPYFVLFWFRYLLDYSYLSYVCIYMCKLLVLCDSEISRFISSYLFIQVIAVMWVVLLSISS